MHSGIFAHNDVEQVGRVPLTAAIGCLAVALVVWVGGTVRAQDADRQHVAEARAALDEYFRAWNAADNDAVAAISNFPPGLFQGWVFKHNGTVRPTKLRCLRSMP